MWMKDTVRTPLPLPRGRGWVRGILKIPNDCKPIIWDFTLVRLTGLEPARPGTLDPKSSASTNSATGAAG